MEIMAFTVAISQYSRQLPLHILPVPLPKCQAAEARPRTEPDHSTTDYVDQGPMTHNEMTQLRITAWDAVL